MKKLNGLVVLMVITILAIAGFQLFWLKQNYDREKQALKVKAGITFREAVYDLQAIKFKLDHLVKDSNKVSLVLKEKIPDTFDFPVPPRKNVVGMVNILREKVKDLKDSLKPVKGTKQTMLVSVDEAITSADSVSTQRIQRDIIWKQPGEPIVKFLYGIDSLQDSLRVTEITAATRVAFAKEKLDVGFGISRMATVMDESIPPSMNAVTIGFVHPVSYKMQLDNTYSYLLKRLSSPILFSVFLISFTIFSFVLLYRNLLQQKRLADLKNDFISNITHELNTPIATVNVAIEALRNFGGMNNPEKTKEYLDISANELGRLSLLINKVLRLSMFEKKEVKLNKELFDLNALVEEVVAIMKLQFDKHEAKVTLHATGENFMVLADRLHMTSVIYNLLDNALKYSKDNPLIEILIASHDLHIDLSIKDNGIGIPFVYRQKIFDKFFRVPTGNIHDTKGYGLGLSYVNNIVRRHHGFITVDSEPGKGSTFTVRIPYHEAPEIRFDDKRRISKGKLKLWR